MNVLGLDISKNSTGYCIVDNNYQIIGCGTLKNKTIVQQSDFIAMLIGKYNIQKIGIEDIFSARNIKTAIELAKIHGAIVYQIEKKNVGVQYFSVMSVKKIALEKVSRKKADGKKKTGTDMKKEVQEKMFEKFGKFCDEKELDITDAASVAYALLKQEVKK